jgi:hypothetical protein
VKIGNAKKKLPDILNEKKELDRCVHRWQNIKTSHGEVTGLENRDYGRRDLSC